MPTPIDSSEIDITQLLNESPVTLGEKSDELQKLIYGELKRIAKFHRRVATQDATLTPTVLVHECYLKLQDIHKASRQWKSRRHFYYTSSLVIRNLVVDYIRRKNSYNNAIQLAADSESYSNSASETFNKNTLQIDEALEVLEKDNRDLAEIILLKFFGGLTSDEIALLLDCSRRTVQREIALAKEKLREIFNASI
jgi:RNA polymerase sigma factor (TIGR02999 family)